MREGRSKGQPSKPSNLNQNLNQFIQTCQILHHLHSRSIPEKLASIHPNHVKFISLQDFFLKSTFLTPKTHKLQKNYEMAGPTPPQKNRALEFNIFNSWGVGNHPFWITKFVGNFDPSEVSKLSGLQGHHPWRKTGQPNPHQKPYFNSRP